MVNNFLEGKVLRIAWERKKSHGLLSVEGLKDDLEESKDQIVKVIQSLSGKGFLVRDFIAESYVPHSSERSFRSFRLSEKGAEFCRSFLNGDGSLQK